jgi:hypothetical protein
MIAKKAYMKKEEKSQIHKSYSTPWETIKKKKNQTRPTGMAEVVELFLMSTGSPLKPQDWNKRANQIQN